MVANDDAFILDERVILWLIASKLAPTKVPCFKTGSLLQRF
jgi:hypothetical protein